MVDHIMQTRVSRSSDRLGNSRLCSQNTLILFQFVTIIALLAFFDCSDAMTVIAKAS